MVVLSVNRCQSSEAYYATLEEVLSSLNCVVKTLTVNESIITQSGCSDRNPKLIGDRVSERIDVAESNRRALPLRQAGKGSRVGEVQRQLK